MLVIKRRFIDPTIYLYAGIGLSVFALTLALLFILRPNLGSGHLFSANTSGSSVTSSAGGSIPITTASDHSSDSSDDNSTERVGSSTPLVAYSTPNGTSAPQSSLAVGAQPAAAAGQSANLTSAVSPEPAPATSPTTATTTATTPSDTTSTTSSTQPADQPSLLNGVVGGVTTIVGDTL